MTWLGIASLFIAWLALMFLFALIGAYDPHDQ